jgi:hypothetical protein
MIRLGLKSVIGILALRSPEGSFNSECGSLIAATKMAARMAVEH